MSFATAKVGGSSAGAFAEYLSEQADLVADYYGSRELDGMAFTRVQGKAASYLGVEQGLTMEQFEDLHHGRWNGQQLSQVSYRPVWQLDGAGKIVRDARGHKVAARDTEGKMITTPHRNAWIDAVWAAPKSVSEYMISTDEATRARIIAAWDAACDEGVRAIEDRAYLLRRTIKATYVDGSRQQGSATERVRGAHLLVVPATQLSARHTEETIARGTPPDPHLHRHNAISTLAWLPDPTHPAGMRPLTVDELGIKKFGEEANAIVMGDFARRLEDIGIELDYENFSESRRGTVGWEVAGTSEEAMRFHSTNSARRNVIVKQWEGVYGRPPTAPELNEALRKSRVSKRQDGQDKEADSIGVWSTWKQNLRDAGIRVPFLQPKEQTRESETQRRIELQRRLLSTKGLCRDNADFTGDTIMNAIQRSAVGLGFTQGQLEMVEQEIREELIVTRQATDDRYRYFTTKEQVTKETRLERGRTHLAAQKVSEPSRPIVEEVLANQEHDLDPQQREAVFAATKGSWVHIEGHAGAGKSSSVGAAREALEKAGLIDETVVVSTAAATAQRSGLKIGADRYGSVESIERMVKSGVIQPSSRRLWIIDEAAMMDTDRLDRLLMAARGQGRFVFVGDPAQLSPIGPGGWYQESVEEHGSVMLDKTYRFKDHRDERDYALLRTGNVEHSTRAVENMAMRDRVHISEDRSERMKHVADAYKEFRDRDPKLSADDIRIIIETTNEDVDTANRFIQHDQKARGELKGEGLEVNDDAQNRSWKLHENESVIFLRTYLPSRKEEPVKNGTRGRILELDERRRRATVELEDQRKVWVKLHEHEQSQPMAPAGAQHANKIQGDEVEVVQVMPGTEHTANANSAYSQLTRARREAHVYLDRETHGDDPEQAVAESWAKRVEKRTSLSRLRERELLKRDITEPVHEKTAEERKQEVMEEKEPHHARREPEQERPTSEPERERETQTGNVAVEEREEEKQQREPKGGSPLRDRVSHFQDRNRETERESDQREQEKINSREETDSPAGRHFSHLRNREQDHGNDIGR